MEENKIILKDFSKNTLTYQKGNKLRFSSSLRSDSPIFHNLNYVRFCLQRNENINLVFGKRLNILKVAFELCYNLSLT